MVEGSLPLLAHLLYQIVWGLAEVEELLASLMMLTTRYRLLVEEVVVVVPWHFSNRLHSLGEVVAEVTDCSPWFAPPARSRQ